MIRGMIGPTLTDCVLYIRKNRGIGAYYCQPGEWEAIRQDMIAYLGCVPFADPDRYPVEHFLVAGIPVVRLEIR